MADTFTVERSTVIDAPPSRVYDEVVDFHRWPGWSPWEDVDPNMEREYAGAEAGEGAVYSWSGNRKAGAGRMEIVKADEPSLVVADLRFTRPFKAQNEMAMHLQPEGTDGQSTRVTWTLTGEKTLITRVMGIFTSMDKMVGPDYEKGLRQLKQLVESPRS